MNKKLLIFFMYISQFLSPHLQAAPPQTLDYKGYLSDSSGVPLAGSVNLSISLYDADAGGTALWTQSGAEILTNGRFSVVLDGTGLNPFPADLFDQQLYVGVTVESDPEMVPRQQLASVPSAFEAINADTVDGMQASEIISAASTAVPTPISSLPVTISSPGSYYLTSNFDVVEVSGNDSIDITANNVTLNLAGFVIDGNGVNDSAITVTGSNVAILNGTVTDFTGNGINLGSSTQGNSVEGIRSIGNTGAGFNMGGDDHQIIRCLAENNTLHGIDGNENITVIDSTSTNNGGNGIDLLWGSVFKSTSIDNQGDGIKLGVGIIKNSSSNLNQGRGINFSNQGSVIENIVSNNMGEGIYALNNNLINGNTVSNNQSWGIYANNEILVNSNKVSGNGINQSSGGIYVNNSSSIKDNNVSFNFAYNIYIQNSGNIIRENHVTRERDAGGTAECLYFMSADNVAIGNTAQACTTPFGGSIPPAARFIDNIGW